MLRTGNEHYLTVTLHLFLQQVALRWTRQHYWTREEQNPI